MTLFPLLPHHLALQIAETACSASVQTLARSASLEHMACEYTPTGGTRVTKEELARLRNGLLHVAAGAGYPEKPSQQQAAEFDADAAVLLAQMVSVAPAEAAKGGVWEFLACVLLPDVVRWRFGGSGRATSIERFVSGRRNAYQRLWWRAFHLTLRAPASRQPAQFLQLLGEDELVQLMERPSLAGIDGLPAAIAAGLLTASARYGDIGRRHLIREVQKRLLRLSSFLSLEAIAPEDVEQHVEAVFAQVAASFLRS